MNTLLSSGKNRHPKKESTCNIIEIKISESFAPEAKQLYLLYIVLHRIYKVSVNDPAKSTKPVPNNNNIIGTNEILR